MECAHVYSQPLPVRNKTLFAFSTQRPKSKGPRSLPHFNQPTIQGHVWIAVLCFQSTQLCTHAHTHTHMHSVSLLLSPGPTLNSSQREGLWEKEAVVVGGGAAEMVEKMQKRESFCDQCSRVLTWTCASVTRYTRHNEEWGGLEQRHRQWGRGCYWVALVFEGSFNEHWVASDPVIDTLLSPRAANTRYWAAVFELWHC